MRTIFCLFEKKVYFRSMNISVYDIIQSKLAVNQDDGVKLFESLHIENFSNTSISFINIDLLSSLFLNESIGRLAIIYGEKISSINFIYPQDKPLFKSKVEDVIENALMGDEYDHLVDEAKLTI